MIGESDVLKVIDQGADDTTNAVSIHEFFKRVTGVNTTERTDDATLIQTRHRIPETPLTEDQIIIFWVHAGTAALYRAARNGKPALCTRWRSTA